MLTFVSLVNDAIDWLSSSSASSLVKGGKSPLLGNCVKMPFYVAFVGAEHSNNVLECFLLLEWSWLQLDSQSEFPCPKSTEDRLVLGAAVGGFVLSEFCSQLCDLEQSHWTILWLLWWLSSYSTYLPGVNGAGLINELVMCFEIHWSDLSACTIKALVPVLICVQVDYSCLLLLFPKHVISSVFAVLLLDWSVWPPFLTTLFFYYFCFLHCIKHRDLYCHLNSYWVLLTFQVQFYMAK